MLSLRLLRGIAYCVLISSFFACSSPAYAGTPEVTLAAVGDVLLARGVGKQIEKHGPDYPLSEVQAVLKRADIAFFNCECPLSERGYPQRRRFLFRSSPLLAKHLRKGGLTMASLANNHTMDYGREAMLDTIESVKNAGILPFGAGVDRRDAVTVRVVQRNGLRVGFLGYTDIISAGVVRLADKPTVAGVNDDDLGKEVRLAKSRCDVLVVSFHWGVEYMKRPTKRQKMLAHIAIDNGADLVLGHHPHVLQPVETYKGKPVIYSIGAFVWDSRLFGADKSAVYLVRLGKSRARLVQKVPVRIISCRPKPCKLQ